MGRCNEFGLQISEGCSHEMLAGDNACTCAGCGVVCGGQFAGCPDVWIRGQPATVRTEMIGRVATLEPVTVAMPTNGPVSMAVDDSSAPANGAASATSSEPPLPPAETPWTAIEAAESAAVAPEAPPEPERDWPSEPVPAASERLSEQEPRREWPSEQAPAPTERRYEREPEPAPRYYSNSAAQPDPRRRPPASADQPSSQGLADVSAELRSVTEGLKMQQLMLGDLLSGLTRQQAMMAELLDARHAELRLAMVAESLPDSVADAVTKSFAANQEQLTETAMELAKSIGMDAAVSKALRQTADRSDTKFEDLSVRLEKLVAKAMRAGARQSTTKPAATRTPTARKPAAPKKARPAAKKPATRKR